LIDELRDTLKGPLDDKARAEIKELIDTLRSNFDKVVQHGRRADAIVKSMLSTRARAQVNTGSSISMLSSRIA
jgi:hypothetical protein